MNTKQILWMAIGAVLFLPQVSAQTGLQECVKLDSPEERLSCFEDLAAQERGAIANEFAEPKLSDGTLKTAAPVTPEVARANLGAEQIERQSPDQGREIQSEQSKTIKTAKEQAREGLTFEVSRFEKDAEQRHILYMDDGQVWREIEPSRVYFPRGRRFSVVINQGSLSDYRLRVNGKGAFTRVVRLR